MRKDGEGNVLRYGLTSQGELVSARNAARVDGPFSCLDGSLTLKRGPIRQADAGSRGCSESAVHRAAKAIVAKYIARFVFRVRWSKYGCTFEDRFAVGETEAVIPGTPFWVLHVYSYVHLFSR